jgi:hypothetical protein
VLLIIGLVVMNAGGTHTYIAHIAPPPPAPNTTSSIITITYILPDPYGGGGGGDGDGGGEGGACYISLYAYFRSIKRHGRK